MDPNDPTTWDFSGTDPNAIPAYDSSYTPTDFDMSGIDWGSFDFSADPGFTEWLNSGDWSTGIGYDTPATTISGYTPDGTPIYADSQAPSAIDWSSLNSALAGLGTGLSGGLSSLGSTIGGLFTQQQTAQQQAAQQNALASMFGTGANLYGGYLNTQAAKEAAQTQANAQIQAARIAADAAKFKPVGVTTRFGQSQFGYDANGNLTSAGYNVSPELKAQQDRLMATSGNMLGQFEGAQQATAPMAAGAQSMFGLGQQYLGTSPQAQAQKYYADQMALLAPQRAQDMAALQAQMQAQGRGGFAMGGDAGMAAANPQLQALMNAQRQQDLGLAAQATQGGMDYAKFGAGMMGLGGQTLQDMYRTQQAAYSPYQTSLGGAQTIEGLGQNALTLGTSLGSTVTAANANAGSLLGSGMANAANTVGNVAQQAGSTWGNLLQGGAGALNQYQSNQQNQALASQYFNALAQRAL